MQRTCKMRRRSEEIKSENWNGNFLMVVIRIDLGSLVRNGLPNM